MGGKKGGPKKILPPLKGWTPRTATPRPEPRREITEDEIDVYKSNIQQIRRDCKGTLITLLL